MHWADERYVRLYTRDTPDWLALSWQARALFIFILRKVDRSGVMDMGRAGERGLAALCAMPQDVVETALPELLADGCVERQGTSLIVPNFLDAQESRASGAARQRECRERRRDMMRNGLRPDQRGTVIYFIQSENGGPIKIGRADDLAKRVVGLQTGRPDKLIVLAAVPGTVADERDLHDRCATIRETGEWFMPTKALIAFIRSLADGALPPLRDRPSSFCDTSPNDECDQSRTVTVTPYRAVPSVPSRTVPCLEEKSPPAAPAEVAAGASSPIVSEPEAPQPKSSPRPEGYAEVVDGYFKLFASHNAGAKPTWNDAQGKMLKCLLKAHKPAEILRRADLMFRAPPVFPRGVNPDFKTLAANFDRFAVEVVDARPAQRAPPKQAGLSFEEIASGSWRKQREGAS